MKNEDLFGVIFMTTLVVSLFWNVIMLIFSNSRLKDELNKLKEKND